MTLPITILTVFASVCALVFTVLRITHGGVISLLTKTLASFAFVCLSVVVAFSHPMGNAGMFLILGQVAGMIGDILLDLKSVDKTRSHAYLNFGMLAFGVGHAFYILFVSTLNSSAKLGKMAFFAGIFAVVFTLAVVLFSKQLLGLKLGNFVFQAGGYSCILSFVAALSVAVCFENIKMLMLAIAMVAFWASDIVLSIMYFGGKKDSKVLSITNHVLYYGAQIAIALFLVTL